jgi:hypothetical protein
MEITYVNQKKITCDESIGAGGSGPQQKAQYSRLHVQGSLEDSKEVVHVD